eukprot:353893-Chlamydomonas_euryale.AAC.6
MAVRGTHAGRVDRGRALCLARASGQVGQQRKRRLERQGVIRERAHTHRPRALDQAGQRRVGQRRVARVGRHASRHVVLQPSQQRRRHAGHAHYAGQQVRAPQHVADGRARHAQHGLEHAPQHHARREVGGGADREDVVAGGVPVEAWGVGSRKGRRGDGGDGDGGRSCGVGCELGNRLGTGLPAEANRYGSGKKVEAEQVGSGWMAWAQILLSWPAAIFDP